MIYLVSKTQELFDSEHYQMLSVEDSITMISSWNRIQFDTETDGRNAHCCNLLCAQFGNDKADTQIVVDCQTIDICLYKEVLETKLLIGQNLKFDLQFLYNYNIIPRRVYDTMIVEQLLYLGYPSGQISYSLKSIADRRLGINIDKTVRGEIIWRGLDTSVIIYAAGDVTHLEKIMASQVKDLKEKNLIKAALVENDAVIAIAYMEWCGIHLDQDKWRAKMKEDKESLIKSKQALDDFVIKTPTLSKYTFTNLQGDLFDGFDTAPKCTINWSSSQQVVKVAKDLGFDTTVQDKKTGEDKDSVLEKQLSIQKGINDEFLKLYFTYQEFAKVVSSFGQGHLNAVNPKTDRIHTVFKQLGAASGRLSCGSNQSDTDLAKLKKLAPQECKYLNIQQLPADDKTRGAFTAPKGYKFVSADFSAEESRLAADIYQDKAFLDEFLYGSKDTHNMFAWIVYRKECEELGCKSATDVKKLAPQWRKKVKGFEFGYMFGAAAPTLSKTAGCNVEEAQSVIDTLDRAFAGMTSYAKKGSRFVKEHGYIIMNPITGHRMNWWDWDKWKDAEKRFNTLGFWDNYKAFHKGTGDAIAMEVREHFQAGSKWDRMARNAVTQGR